MSIASAPTAQPAPAAPGDPRAVGEQTECAFATGDIGKQTELPCQVQDSDLWFAERPADLELAKSWCARCPVREACLVAAVERREPWGVWGGEIFERGAVIARKRPRGRPRKDDPYRVPAPAASSDVAPALPGRAA